jgi:argininosuccinate lyase
MTSLLNIGASEKAVKYFRAAVLDILAFRRDEETIRKALDVFQHALEVNNTMVQGCTFTAERLQKQSRKHRGK